MTAASIRRNWQNKEKGDGIFRLLFIRTLQLVAITVIGALIVLAVGALVVLIIGVLIVGTLIVLVVLDAVVIHFCAPPSCKNSLTDPPAFMQEKCEKNC